VELDTAPDERVLDVSEFYQAITAHLESAFGRRRMHWVRGEIQKTYEKGHLYLDVVDASGAEESQPSVLKVRCWSSVWTSLKRQLADQGIVLRDGMVVSFHGYVGLYKPRGEISFAVTEIDVQGLLGDAAKQRQILIDALTRDGSMERNKNIPMASVPLRIGLVASPHTEGYNDFTGQLLRSGFGFQVTLVPATVQGDSAPDDVVRALQKLQSTDVDVVCVIRGGGSRGDLAAFDDERVARAIADSRIPVLTGIGHTGDISIADLVAHRHAITPTKLGEELVTQIAEWRERHVTRAAERVARWSVALTEEATEYVAERRRTVMLAVRDRLTGEQRRLSHVREGLARHARHLVETESARLASTRQLLAAYDPERRLAQGWTIVSSLDGRVVRSVNDVRLGETVILRVVDGRIGTTVTDKKGDA